MPKIEWADFLELGEPEIDSQHKRLVEIINTFLNAADTGCGSDAMKRTLDDLLDYADTHFAAEEQFMERLGFPGLEAHRREHQNLRREVLDRLDKFMQCDGSILEMQAFLTSWLVGHVMGWDGMILAHGGEKD